MTTFGPLENLLRIEGLTVGFSPERPVLQDVALTQVQGERRGLLGPSGSGKSLLAYSILGLLPPTAMAAGKGISYRTRRGEVIDLLTCGEDQLRRLRGREIGLIFQEPLTALNPTLRAGRQLLETAELLRPDLTSAGERRACVHRWLHRVRLGEDADRILRAYPHELSGGQRQRLLIAMALLPRPRLLIADEPTTALDAITEAGILNLIDELIEELGMSLLYVTHDAEVMRRMVDRVTVLENGRVVREGSTAEMLPDTTAPAPVSPEVNGDASVLTVADLHVNHVGRKRYFWEPRPVVEAVRGVRFHLRLGEWLAILGPSGCGKSTLARTLTGLIPAHRGDVATTGNIQLIPQDPGASLNPRHRLRTILTEVLHLDPDLPRRDRPARVDALLHRVGLPPADYRDRYPHELSGGQRQRVAIARALAARPAILIADESVSGLDEVLRDEMLRLLTDLCREDRLALLFITHDVRLARDHADRVLLMEAGRIVERGPARAVLTTPTSGLGKSLVRPTPAR